MRLLQAGRTQIPAVSLTALLALTLTGCTGQTINNAGRANESALEPASSAMTSDCAIPAGDQSTPNGPLGDKTITITPELSVPDVDGIGPGIRSGITRCFAHSPTGSVVAAANYLKWMSSNERLPEVTKTLLAAGSDRDRMVADVEAHWDRTTTTAVTIEGYKIEIRSTDEVLVTLAFTLSADAAGRMTAWPLVMVWEDGDWKVKPPSNGSWGQEAIDSPASEGMTTWKI